jgi:hypothetical protein
MTEPEVPPFTTTPLRLEDIRRLKAAGCQMLDEAFAALAAEHVIPCPDGYPYVRVGRDFEGGDVMFRPRWKEFSRALDELFPEWFRPPKQGTFPRWFSEPLMFSFLEAAIARIGRMGGPYSGSHPAAVRLIFFLIRYLRAPEQEVAAAVLMGHLTTDSQQDVQIGDLRLSPITSFREYQVVSQLIPTAPAAANRELPDHFARPECWVMCRATGTDPFAIGATAERAIDRFLFAIRLLYHGTAHPIYQVVGETTEICQRDAELTPYRYSSSPIALRPIPLSQTDDIAITGILNLYDRVSSHRKDFVVHPLDMATNRFGTTFLPKPWYEDVVDLMTALEATLSGVDRQDITLRICSRAAALLATPSDPPSAVFGDLKKLYDMRSTLVHGSAVTDKALTKCTSGLTTSRPSPWPAVRVERGVDRLRDLVRRAILARVALADAGTWPFDTEPETSIDQALADPGTAANWRDSWQSIIQAIEPRAVEPAAPLLDAIHDDYPGKRP